MSKPLLTQAQQMEGDRVMVLRLAGLVAAILLFVVIYENGVTQHAMYCRWAADDIAWDAGRPGFEKALASWKKFQIEDNCPADGVR